MDVLPADVSDSYIASEVCQHSLPRISPSSNSHWSTCHAQDEAVFVAKRGPWQVAVLFRVTAADATGNTEAGREMAFAIEIDGIRILHLGLPSASPISAILKGFEDVDVLLMPVGGGISLSGSSVTDIMETIDPRIAIPMHYKTAVEIADLDFLDVFLKETGSKPEPIDKLQVTRSSVPEELTLMVLSPKS